MRSIAIFLFLAITLSATAQQSFHIDMLTTGTNTSLRGMSVPTDDIVWVSGSNGTVGKSTDGGKNWQWMIVPGFEKRDFRDIEAFDSLTAIVMVVDNPANILKTTDGGKNWKKVFERAATGMFLDAMDFKDGKEGVCVGDPINLSIGGASRKLFYIIRTHDGGDTWAEAPMYQMPPALTGEFIFAASGTNISFLNHPDYEYAFITGGYISTLYFVAREGKTSKGAPTPILQGTETRGAYSFATDGVNKFYAIGGDYKVPRDYFDNFYYSNDCGKKWGTPTVGPPFGYRSCVRIINDKSLVACGPTGVDYTDNAQKEWKRASLEGFNVCMVSKGKKIFLAGEKGKIGRLLY